MVIKVLIDSSVKKLNKVYDYLVPKDLEEKVCLGKRVLINFGRGKGQLLVGIIVKILSETETHKKDKKIKLKEIEEILDNASFIDDTKLTLAKWMARVYFCNVFSVLKLMLPISVAKLSSKKEDLKGKQVSILLLNVSSQNIEEHIDSGIIKSAKHIMLLRFLIEHEFAYVEDIINNLGVSKAVINTVKEKGYIKIEKIDILNEDYSNVVRDEKLKPTKEQKIIIDSLNKDLQQNKFKAILIQGITGSGKTEVYLQAIEECIKQNKTAIVLVPEISLTEQTKKRFLSRFGPVVSVLHSKMTMLAKETEYKRIVKNRVSIVIGPRSALFVPLKNLGLIIIDEEHDTSYISQQTPKYNTKEVATRLAYMKNAVLVLGSATPEVGTMYKAQQKKIDYYRLDNRPGDFKLPEVIVVDMKEEKLINKSSIISNKLKEEILKNIDKKEQTFIFLNRRGYSNYLICKTCGHILKCINCDVNLTYHKKSNLMLCHYCSHVEKNPTVCPACSSPDIDLCGMGTEQVEKALLEVFPNITIARMDADTTIKRGSHAEILDTFKLENVNILVGTQMISKGHDIENVTLVGIINADATFAGNDFMSSERAFSNLLQVSGRAGRGEKKGRVVMQVYDTENSVIKCVEKQSYDKFYEEEIKFRELANYPPFTDILVIELISKDKNLVKEDTMKLYEILIKSQDGFKVYSPKAPYIGKINNKFRVQIVIKGKQNNDFLDILYENLKKYDKIKKRDVSITISKNPIFIG